MLNLQIGNDANQEVSQAGSIKVQSGDKVQISAAEGSSYQVLIADNGADVILNVTEADGTTYDVVIENLAAMYEAGDISTQLLLDIDGETMTVSNTAELLEALAATAAGGPIDQNNRGLGEDAANIDPNRSAADDSDQLRPFRVVGFEDTEGNDRPIVSDVALAVNEILGVEQAGDKNIITGQLVAFDPDVGDTHTFQLVPGTLSVSDTNGVIDIVGDEIEVVINPDGTYTISGDFNDLSDGETATVSFDYTATDQEGLVSVPATVTLSVTGTNDIPVVEDISLNTEGTDAWLIGATTMPMDGGDYYGDGGDFYGDGESYYDIIGASLEEINALFYTGEGSVEVSDLPGLDEPTDGAALKFTMNVEAGETVTFNWTFYDAEGNSSYYNDFSFVVIDGHTIQHLADVEDPGTTNNGVFTHTFTEGGTHEITFGVMNDNDQIVDSHLVVSHTSGGLIVDMDNAGHYENIGESSGLLYETHDSEDVPLVDDTQDEPNNIYTGLLSVADDDVMNEGLHTFHIVQDGEGNNIVNVSSPDSVVTAEDINVGTLQNPDGSWSYTINGDFGALAAGEKAYVTFQYYADDTRGFGTEGTDIHEPSISEPKTIALEITGTNDQPIAFEFADSQSEVLDGLNIFNGTLPDVLDEDVSDTHTYHGVGEEGIDYEVQSPVSVSIEGITINSDGSYEVSGDFNALAVGEVATVTFQYYVDDQGSYVSGGGTHESSISEPKTVTLTVIGTNDAPVIASEPGTGIYFMGEEASYDNILIAYELDGDGNPMNPTLAVMDTNSGYREYTFMTVVDTPVDELHFAIIADGQDIYPNIDQQALSFDNSGAYPKLMVDGSIVTGRPVYFDINGFNPDGKDHFDVDIQENGAVRLVNIEDLNLGDNDRDDLNVKLMDTETILQYDTDEVRPQGEVVGTVIATDVDVNDILTYSFIDGSGNEISHDKFEINPNSGEISVKGDLDYETAVGYDLRVKVEDNHGASDIKDIRISVNDITGVVTHGEKAFMVDQTFSNWNNEGWTTTNWGSWDFMKNRFGMFFEGNTAQNELELGDDFANKEVDIDFDLILKQTPGSWESDDSITVTANGQSQTIYATEGDGLYHVKMSVVADDDGKVDIDLDSDVSTCAEVWGLDNFQISSQDQVLTFDTPSEESNIDMAALLDQSNDFEDAEQNSVENPESLDEIDLAGGDHILSNLTLEDFVAMTDSDKVLKITGDSNDDVSGLSDNGWQVDDTPTVTEIGYTTYTNAADTSVQLLIDDDILDLD